MVRTVTPLDRPLIFIIIIYLSKTSKHINRANQFKNTYNIGLDAKVHVGLFNRLHVARKNNTKIEMIYNHITPKYRHCDTQKHVTHLRKFSKITINLKIVFSCVMDGATNSLHSQSSRRGTSKYSRSSDLLYLVHLSAQLSSAASAGHRNH